MKISKYIYHLIITILFCFAFNNNDIIKAQEINLNYTGELGSFYTVNQTVFKVYSSTAAKVSVVVEGKEPQELTLPRESNNNIWIGYVAGNLNGKEYSLTIEDADGNVYENVLDPYGKYLNKEGTKNVICDDSVVLFEEWTEQANYLSVRDKSKVIYGVNIKNFTSHSSWGGNIVNKGNLLALTESGVNSYLTGFDHIKSLGITHLELSRVNDTVSPFAIDREIVSGINVYSGKEELMRVVNEYYLNNIGVVIAVDYKGFSENLLNSFKVLDESSYLGEDGRLDLSKKMSQEYIYELLKYYVETYKLSGIRIENLNDYSISFVNKISESLKEINKNILLYGDGKYETENEGLAGENTLSLLNNISLMNGSFSYALFGNLLNDEEKGVLDGNYSDEVMESMKFALLSGVDNGDINYDLVKGVSYKNYWGNKSSFQLINYIGQATSLSIYDKLSLSNITMSDNTIKQKVILAYGTLMLSGGIPYIYSGEEFLMSYQDVERSGYSICDSNDIFCYYVKEQDKVIDWSYANKNEDVVNAFKSLINYRKSGNSVAQNESNVIKNNVEVYLNDECPGLIGFIRNYPGAYTRDTEKVFAVINFSNNDYTIEMGGEGWFGLYTYNSSTRDGDKLILRANSIYTEAKEKQPKVSQWITLLLVVGIIGGIYCLNIFLNNKLVEKKGYEIGDIKKKYRPFIRKKTNEDAEIEQENAAEKSDDKTDENDS